MPLCLILKRNLRMTKRQLSNAPADDANQANIVEVGCETASTIKKPIRKSVKGYAKMDLQLSVMRVGMSTTLCPLAK